MLMPRMLRALRPELRIGYFHHVPFPSFEVVRLLPWREELLRGLLGADVVGFHTLAYAEHMLQASARLCADVAPLDDDDALLVDGRCVRVGAFPIGIDAAAFRDLARSDAVRVRVAGSCGVVSASRRSLRLG